MGVKVGWRNDVPEGLPALLDNGERAFQRLCSLVGLEARTAKQTFLESPVVKAALEKVGFRTVNEGASALEPHLQIAAFYESPNTRLEVWRSAYAAAWQKEIPLSLEVRALDDYESGVLAKDVDEGALAACEGLVDATKKEDAWRHPALVALPSLHRDFGNWDQLKADRRQAVVLAGFAAATILEDVRLLRWAIERVPTLADEYNFLAGDQPPSSEAALRMASVALATAAHNLIEATVPTAAMFDEVARTSVSVEELREPILSAHETAKREVLVNTVLEHVGTNSSLVDELGNGFGRLRTLWESTYLNRSEADVAILQDDVARVIAELAEPLAEWNKKMAEVRRIEQDFDPTRGSRAKQQWSSAYTKAQDGANELWQALETVLAPTGHRFDAHDNNNQDVGDDYPEDARREDQSVAPSAVAAAAEGPSLAESQPSDPQSTLSDMEATSFPQPAAHSPRPTHVEGSGGIVQQEALSAESKAQPHSEKASGRREPPSVEDVTAERATTGDQADSAEPVHIQPQPHPVWLALEDRRVGIAYHIARLDPDIDDKSVPSADLVAALALAHHIGSPDGPLIQRYTESLRVVADHWRSDTRTKDALNLILFAATVQPALFAPSAGALPVLLQLELSPDLSPVAEIAEKISEHCERLQAVHLDEHLVPLMLDSAKLDREIGEVKEAIRDWIREQAPLQRFSFVPITRIWQFWQRSGLIFDIDKNVVEPSKKSLDEIKALIHCYEDDRAFVAYVHETNRDVPKGHAGDIDRLAVDKLRRAVDPLMTLATAWVDLMDMHIASRPDYVQRTLGGLARDLRTAIVDWPKNTRENTEQAPFHIRIALSYAEDAINRLWGHFEQHELRDVRLAETLPDPILSRDLLLVPNLAVNMDHGIKDESVVLPQLLRYREVCVNTLGNAFEARLKRRDIGGAYLITEWMSAESDVALEKSERALRQAIDEERSQAEDARGSLVADVERAYARGQIDGEDRNRLAALVTDRPSESLRSLLHALDDYECVRAELTTAKEASIADLRQKHMPYVDNLSDEPSAVLDATIDAGDRVLARELEGKLSDGELVLSPDGEVDYLAKFLASAPEVESSFGDDRAKPTVDQIDRAAKAGADFAGLSFGVGVHKDLLPSQLLEPWYSLARQKSVQPILLKRVLEALGFVDVQIEAKGAVATVIARPLMDRRLCPLHQYGSTAEGKYEVLLNWGPVQNSLIQSVPDTYRHVIVLHFGHLAKDRDWLRQWSLDSHRRLIVLDETLVLFLSTIALGRLRAFFDCTLPFTCIDPFVTTASLVPPELFYGRASEREKIMDKYGSCFVYGGRQIGKTALLRSAEAAFHRPEEAHVARWIDLKANEIGLAREPASIWEVLWRELGEAGVILSGERPPSGQQGLVDRVRSIIVEWIKQGDDRRILLLLDEADAFLETDAGSDFRESTRLKGIMDSTHREFKVVFSGLHNVLRTTERSNHPLAHLGEPICVGPLLSEGEWKEAQELVRQPLSAVGCRFKDSAPIFHTLARTNYYPSLIQLFGAELARYVRDRHGRFPYAVDVDDIGNVFRSGTVREAIRQRFQLTLQLDSRYEVIAYAMALEFGTNERAHASGLHREAIFDHVRGWWEKGFVVPGTDDPIPIASFDALLQEMVGLGVLRPVEGHADPVVAVHDPVQQTSYDRHRQADRYTLRNLNILPLLGTDDEIEQTLLKEREVPKRFDPASFRARYKKNDSAHRGMLTFEQEEKLRRGGGVSIIVGNAAAGIDEVPAFLADRIEADSLRHIPSVSDAIAFERHLTGLRPERNRGTQVCLVPFDSPWNVPWLKRALTALHRIQRGSLIRVVFVATPATLWRTMEDVENEDGLYERLDWVNVEPWDRTFLERWCDDLNLGVDPADIDSLLQKTGGWAVVLKSFEHSPRSWRDRFQELDALVARERNRLLRALGVEDEEVERQMQVILGYEESSEMDMWALEKLERDDGTAMFSEPVLRRRLGWARQLGLVRATGEKIVFNPLVKQVL